MLDEDAGDGAAGGDPTHERTKEVLLVEDSSATQDLVKLILEQSGHIVEIASDGAAALTMLREIPFDVVLTDFHLPDMTGLDVVRAYLARAEGPHRPRFIAITGDMRGLLSDRAGCEVFERVVPKPLDIDMVCALVEEDAPQGWRPPVPLAATQAAPLGELGLALMRWPPGQGPAPAPDLAGIDAILVTEAVDMAALWALGGAHLLPVLDGTGRLGASADADISTGRTQEVRDLVDLFHERASDLHPDFARSSDEGDRLLARIHVAGGALTPRRSADHEGLVAWNTIAPPCRVETLIASLAAEGLVETEFFERVHRCPGCGSARLIVREECPACHSADLEEESYIHHFRCAYQGPEGDFRSGADLTCPKCRRELRHFGHDYDRPGLMTSCRSCGASTSEPPVAFVCARCDARHEGDAIEARDIHAARPSEAGRTYLRAGRSFLGPARRSLRFADLPLEMIVALNRAASAYNEAGRPFTLVQVSAPGLEELRRGAGARSAARAREMWLEALGQALGAEAAVSRAHSFDFVLLPGTGPAEAGAPLAEARRAADAAVRGDLRAAFQLFGPEDIAG